MSSPQHYWQLVVLDQNGNTVDFPQSDVESIKVTKQLNGGSGNGTITFRRYFNDVGAIGFSYQFLLYIWNSTQSKPSTPYWAGFQVDPEQIQQVQSGQVVVNAYGDFTLLDDSLFSATINPGITVSGITNPNLDAASLLTTMLTGSGSFNPPSTAPYRFTTPVIPSAMFDLEPLQFTHEKLGSAIDTICKQGRDVSGALFIWYVATDSTGQRQIIIEVDQNPNLISGLKFRHIFVDADFDQYDIQTKYRDITNVVAVYGYQDPNTGAQVFGVYSDAVSISELTRTIETAITVPSLQTTAACQQYAQIYFDLNAFPTAQGQWRMLNPDPTIDIGTWVQIWEAPATGSSDASIKQVRISKVDVNIQKNRVEQVCYSDSPRPYLDDAIYRLGGDIVTRQAIAAPPSPINRQQVFIRAGGTLTAIHANAAKVALTACEAVFNGSTIFASALSLTQLTDNSGGPNNGQTGAGNWTVSVNSSGSWIFTLGDRPVNSATQQNVLGAYVDLATLTPSCYDIRTLSGQPAMSNLTAPTLKSGTTVSMPTPANAGSGAYDQPVTFWLDPATWTNANSQLAYLEVGAVPHGSSQAVAMYSKLPPNATGDYTTSVPGLGAGTSYDIYVWAVDNLDRPTGTLLLGTTLTNTLSTTSGPKMPGGASFTASSISLGSMDAGYKTLYASTASTALHPVLTYQFTMVESTSPDMSNWGVNLVAFVRVQTSGGTTTASTYQAPIALIPQQGLLTNGFVCEGVIPGVVTPGTSYDVAVAVADGQGDITGLVYLGSVTVPKVSSGTPIGPVIGKPHIIGSTSTDTSSIYDNANDTLAHRIMSAGVTGVINSDSSHNATDLQSFEELAPGNANAGLWYSSYTGNVWDKTGTLMDLTRAPFVYEATFKQGTHGDIYFIVCGSAAVQGNQGTFSGYAIGYLRTGGGSTYLGLRGYKYTSGSDAGIGTEVSLGGLDPTKEHRIKIVASYNGSSAVNLWVQIDDSTPWTYTDSSSPITNGYVGMYVTNGIYIRNVDWSHSAPQAQNTVGGYANNQLTPDSNGSYLTHGTVYDAHIGGVKVDTLTDATYARVKATELTSGTVKQLNDGTNTRTAAQVAGAIDTSSRIIGSVYDGTTALTPANLTNAVTSAGLVKVANATGTLPYSNHAAEVTSTLASSADAFGNYLDAGSVSRFAIEKAGTTSGGTNLIYNPTFAANIMISTAPNIYGWTDSGTGVYTWGTEANNGGQLYCTSTTASRSESIYQTISVIASTNYVISGYTESANANGNVEIIVWAGATPGGSVLTSYTNNSGSAVLTPFFKTFASGSNTQVCIEITMTGTGTVNTWYVGKLQLEAGAQPSPYVDHLAAATHNANFNAAGSLARSTGLNALTPNLLDWTTDLQLNYSSSGTSPNITMTFWYDNSGLGTDAHIYNPDGSVVNVSHTTSTSGDVTLTGVSSSASIYVLMYYTIGSGMTLTPSKTAPPLTGAGSVSAAKADGGYVAINATTQATQITGGSSGHRTGGGGGNFL